MFATPTSHAVQCKSKVAPVTRTVFVDSATFVTPALHRIHAV
jgi:hypothetical protein